MQNSLCLNEISQLQTQAAGIAKRAKGGIGFRADDAASGEG
jgi:hypothetical protein